jgi:regulator of replication initiation timing
MQQVNLYQTQFKPKQIILPAQHMLLIALLPIIIFVITSIYFSYKQQLFETLLHTKQQQLQLDQQHLSVLKQHLNLYKEDPKLIVELNAIRGQLQKTQTLLAHLASQESGNQHGFSAMLTALSKQHIDDLWLTQFSLLNGGQFIALQGRAYTPQLIPEYIDNLAKSEQFQGENFSVFQLQQQTDSSYYNFKLHTEQKNGGRNR